VKATPVQALVDGGVAVVVEDLTVSRQRHPAVHHLSGRFEQGSLTAVVGPNGAGKSSLLQALAGELPVAGGRLHVDPALRRRMAYLPQGSAVDRSLPLTVRDFVLWGDWRSSGAFGRVRAAAQAAGGEALAAVGLEGFERRTLAELSVGQFQRVLFARLMLQDASLILLDEPFAAIDERTSHDLLALVQRWHGERRTVIAVLHDLEQVRRVFPRTLLLAREPVAWGPTAQVLDAEHLSRARGMAERWDDAAPECHRHELPVAYRGS
jgi:zinc/manganese transport system ATP-binding protein